MHLENKTIKDFSNSFKELKNSGCDFISYIKTHKLDAMIIWFFLILSYGVKLFFYNISADTEIILNDHEFMMSSWTGIDRFGLVLTKKLLKLIPFNPFVANFLMLCTLFTLLMFLSFIFSDIGSKFSIKIKYNFILPCIFITHPFFCEQFNYTLQAFEVSFAIFLAFLSAFLITKWIFKPDNILHLVIGMCSLVWSFWSYQAILFLYISLVLAIFVWTYTLNVLHKSNVLDMKFNKNFFRMAAAKYILSFTFSYVLYFFANKVVKTFLRAGEASYLENMVEWGQKSPTVIVKNILGSIFGFLGIKIYVLMVIMFLFILFMSLKPENKNKLLFAFSVLALCSSPAFLSFYLGHPAVPRTQFSMPFLFAFVFFAITQFLNKKILLRLFLAFIAFFESFKQGYGVANMLYAEYMRYEYDVSLANKIDERINLLDIEDNKEIPILFDGMLVSPAVKNGLRGNNVGVSFFEWHWTGDPTGVTHIALGFMKTLGYNNYRMPTDNECQKGLKIAKTMKAWPSPHAVKYEDGIVVVKLPQPLN